jgi:hypothetical protein
VSAAGIGASGGLQGQRRQRRGQERRRVELLRPDARIHETAPLDVLPRVNAD